MSVTQLRARGASPQSSPPVPRVTADALLQKKLAGHPITAITAYDYPTARLVDEAGIDMVLVGDSLGMVVLGYENTLPVTLDEMLHHTRAVARALRRAFLVADMPYGSYHASIDDATRNALRFIKDAGAQAVKIEGGASRAELVHRLTDAEIPVVGHIGLTPQSVHSMGGYRVQGRTLAAMDRLAADARALEDAGAVAIVLEGIPRELAARITHQAAVPTIGIGAGPDCDGQILLARRKIHPPVRRRRRLLHLSPHPIPRRCRRPPLPLRRRKLSPIPRGPVRRRRRPPPRPQSLKPRRNRFFGVAAGW